MGKVACHQAFVGHRQAGFLPLSHTFSWGISRKGAAVLHSLRDASLLSVHILPSDQIPHRGTPSSAGPQAALTLKGVCLLPSARLQQVLRAQKCPERGRGWAESRVPEGTPIYRVGGLKEASCGEPRSPAAQVQNAPLLMVHLAIEAIGGRDPSRLMGKGEGETG